MCSLASSPVEGCVGNTFTCHLTLSPGDIAGCVGNTFPCHLTLSPWDVCCPLGEVGCVCVCAAVGGSPFHSDHKKGFHSTDLTNVLGFLVMRNRELVTAG